MKSKIHTLKPTKKQIEVMKNYWKKAVLLENNFYRDLCKLEDDMTKDLKVKNTTLEFFFCDNGMVGIGDYNRTIELTQKEELEKK